MRNNEVVELIDFKAKSSIDKLIESITQEMIVIERNSNPFSGQFTYKIVQFLIAKVTEPCDYILTEIEKYQTEKSLNFKFSGKSLKSIENVLTDRYLKLIDTLVIQYTSFFEKYAGSGIAFDSSNDKTINWLKQTISKKITVEIQEITTKNELEKMLLSNKIAIVASIVASLTFAVTLIKWWIN